MAPRQILQQILEVACDNVYFQTPTNVQMSYPAIVYRRARAEESYADNVPYMFIQQYDLTLITRDPDENLFHIIKNLPMCRHDRFFVSDNLNHDVFTIYF
jgi:hypothetical protein